MCYYVFMFRKDAVRSANIWNNVAFVIFGATIGYAFGELVLEDHSTVAHMALPSAGALVSNLLYRHTGVGERIESIVYRLSN
jgi:hypothetical protein